MTENILNVLCSVDSSEVSYTVDQLLREYKEGHTLVPLHRLVCVVAQASGAVDVDIKQEDVDSSSVDVMTVLENLYQSVSKDSMPYMLVHKDPKYKKFPQRFDELIIFFIKSAFSAGCLFDERVMPSLSQWLVAMSESKRRSFRHTATAAVLSAIQALNELEDSLKSRLSFVRESAEMTDVQSNLTQLTQWRDHFFSNTVHQRLRDVAPEIRLAAVQKIKQWIISFPDVFMENKYLRYFGMPLHDKRPNLRAEALDMMLQGLGKVDGAFERMKLFIQYFLKRIVEMSSDVDTHCVELALRLMAMIVKRAAESSHHGDELLTSEMIDTALRSLFDERHAVRAAAGVLLNVFVHTRASQSDEEGDQFSVAAELVGSFAGTLRKHYKEDMPEKFLVDALWSGDVPPPLLVETNLLTALSESNDAEEVVVGLGFMAGILQKIQNTLSLGPQAKDERRAGNPKLSSTKQKQQDEIKLSLISKALTVLPKILKNCTDKGVFRCSAELLRSIDFSTVASSGDQKSLRDVMLMFRHACMKMSLDSSTVKTAAFAWEALSSTIHPLRSEAEAHVGEMMMQTKKQADALTTSSSKKGAPPATLFRDVSSRVFLLSSLLSIGVLLPSLEHHFSPFLNVATTGDAVTSQYLVGSFLNNTLWELTKYKLGDGNEDDKMKLEESVRKMVQLCFTASPYSDLKDDVTSLELYASTFTSLCDVATLSVCQLSQHEQEELMKFFECVFENVSSLLRVVFDEYRAAQNLKAETMEELHQRLHQSRCAVFHWEAIQLRLVEGIGRLILLNKMDYTYVPRFLFFWTQSPAKSVPNAFKRLFHSVRDNAGDSFALERDAIAFAYRRCVDVGATPLAVEAMYQLGQKLSSLHFVLTADRYYSACVSIVQYAIEFASTVDPLILQGVQPYCMKLRVPEALHFIRHEVPARDIFKAAAHPLVRAFISSLAKAAKVDDPMVGEAKRKRSRELGVAPDTSSSAAETAFDELVESVTTTTTPSRQSGRVVTSDGWHVRPDEEPQSSQQVQRVNSNTQKNRRLAVHVPSTQETIASETLQSDDGSEAFIGSADYE